MTCRSTRESSSHRSRSTSWIRSTSLKTTSSSVGESAWLHEHKCLQILYLSCNFSILEFFINEFFFLFEGIVPIKLCIRTKLKWIFGVEGINWSTCRVLDSLEIFIENQLFVFLFKFRINWWLSVFIILIDCFWTEFLFKLF